MESVDSESTASTTDDGGGELAAFSVSTVIKQTSFKIESIACWGDRLYVGTSEGKLMIYDKQASGEVPGVVYHLTESKRRFQSEKKPIVKLQVVHPWGIILCMSDR
jgi:hypothetical protein